MAKVRRRTQHRRRQSRSPFWRTLTGVILLILVGTAIFFFFYLNFSQSKKHIELSRENNCPLHAPPSHVTVLIVDATDPLNRIQKSSVNNLLDKLVSEVPRYGAFAIYTVSTDEEHRSQLVIYRCNPGRKEDINPMFGNPERVEKKWKDQFRKSLNDEMKKSLESGTANSSPIMESIQWAVVKQFEPSERTAIPHRLVVISDFLQHTSEYSHYRIKPDFPTFENSKIYRKVRANLIGADVSLWLVRRNSKVSNALLEQFWEAYFRAQGADEVHVKNLPG